MSVLIYLSICEPSLPPSHLSFYHHFDNLYHRTCTTRDLINADVEISGHDSGRTSPDLKGCHARVVKAQARLASRSGASPERFSSRRQRKRNGAVGARFCAMVSFELPLFLLNRNDLILAFE